MRPKVGLVFLHKTRGVECRVVRVTKTSVYYRLSNGIGGGNVHVKNWGAIYSETEDEKS